MNARWIAVLIFVPLIAICIGVYTTYPRERPAPASNPPPLESPLVEHPQVQLNTSDDELAWQQKVKDDDLKAIEERRLAAQRKDEEKERQRLAEKLRLASTAVDLKWDRLPVGFMGNDPVAIYGELAKRLERLGRKDDFDTEAQYQSKVTHAVAGPLLGSLTITSLICLAPSEGIGYDAEGGKFSYSLNHGFFPFVELATLSSRQDDTYIGENAFGVKKEIDVTTKEILKLMLNNAGDFDDVAIPMPGDQARGVAAHLHILLIGIIPPPYLTTKTIEDFPTLTNPSRRTTIEHTLPFSLHEIWVVRNDDGKIVDRVTPWTADPRAVMNKVEARVKTNAFYEKVSVQVDQAGGNMTASLRFSQSYIGNWEVRYTWHEGKWILSGGTYNSESHGKIELRPKYGPNDDEVPEDCRP